VLWTTGNEEVWMNCLWLPLLLRTGGGRKMDGLKGSLKTLSRDEKEVREGVRWEMGFCFALLAVISTLETCIISAYRSSFRSATTRLVWSKRFSI
jgi:hypothetical protein